MFASSRAVRVVAGVAIGLAATLLVLSTTWARQALLEWATERASDRSGLVIRAAGLHYAPASLALTLDDLSIGDPARPGQPFLRIAQVELDFAASALRGRLDLDRIRLRHPVLVLDASTRPPGRAAGARAPTAPPAAFPAFAIDVVEIDDFDFALALGDDETARIDVQDVAATLHGRGAQVLEGDVTAAGGVGVSFRSAGFDLAFPQAEARVILDAGRRLATTVLSAHSPVAELRAEGDVPLDAQGGMVLRYETTGQLAQLGRWWPDGPALRGRVTAHGRVDGPWRALQVSFDAASPDAAWSSLRPAVVGVSGGVSSAGLALDAVALASPQGRVEGSGRLTFDATQRSAFEARWRDVDGAAVTQAVAAAAVTLPPVRTSGNGTLSWPGRRPTIRALEGRVDATAHAGQPGAAVGGLQAEAESGRWRVEHQQALEGLTRGSVDGVIAVDADRFERSSIDGTIRVESQHVGQALDHLRRLGVRLPASVATVGSDHVAFDGVVSGLVEAPRARGALSADGVRFGSVAGMRLDGTVAVDTRALVVSPLSVEIAGSRALFRGTLPWRGDDGEGSIEVSVTDISELAASVPDAWRPGGTVQATGEWHGSMAAPRLSAHVSATGATANGLAFDSISGDLEFADRLLQVPRLRATQAGGGTLDATGTWHLADGRLVADVSGTGLTMSLIAEDQAGTVPRARAAGVSVEAHVDGALPGGVARAAVAADAVEIGGQPVGRVAGDLDAADGVSHVRLAVAGLGAQAEGQVRHDAPLSFDGRLTLADTDVATLARLGAVELPELRLALGATADLAGSLRDLAGARATIALTALRGAVRGRPVTLARPGQARLEDRAVRMLEPVRLVVGDTTIDLAPPVGTTTDTGVLVTLDGTIADAIAVAPVPMLDGVTADGTVRAQLRVDGRVDVPLPTGTVTLDLVSLRRGDRELARGVRVEADADEVAVRVRAVDGSVLGSAVRLQAAAPLTWIRAALDSVPAPADEPATFTLESDLDVAPLLSAMTDSPLDITGRVSVVVEGRASAPRLDAVQATLVQQAGDVKLGAVALAPVTPTRLRLADGELLVEAFEWSGPESRVVASGRLGLAAGRDGRLDLRGDASLALLTLFAAARAGGRATFDLGVSGPPGTRALLGTVKIDDGSLVVPRWRLAMDDWSGTLTLDGNGVDVTALRGQFNGGEASIDGRLPLRGDLATTDVLTISVAGAFLDVPRGLRSQVDAALEWRHAGGTRRLSGDVTVAARTYREPVTALARLVAALIDGSGRRPAGAPTALDATELDVRLATIGPLAMTNSVARVELLPDLRLTGTLGRPALDGQVAVVDDGRIQFGGRQYRLRDSRIEFQPESGMIPRLAIAGTTRVSDYTVNLRLSGPANEVETSLSSEPPLGERDLQTLLVTGQRETFGREGTADESAVGVASGDVLGIAGQFLGFDSVVVGTTDDLALVSSDVDPALRLTVSKRLGTRFELVLSDNLDDNELTWVVIYRPRPGFEFRVVSRDNTEFTGEFRQEITFGPGVSPPRTAPRERVAPDRISAVSVSGEPGLATDDVLSATELHRGDDFDFGRWLEDRERIAAHYQARGYFAARIVPTRRPAGSGQVALDYRITRGPHTVLSVAGYTAPTEVLDRLRQAWADSALVELLDADLAAVMREHLVERGYLRAGIEVTVERPTADTITATVQVTPGPLTSQRRLAFSGNSALDEEALLAVAEASAARGADPWLDPAALVEDLDAAYAARGYLAAVVTPGEIAFAEASATLPIHVVEGAQAHVATLTVTGAESLGEADAAAGTGLAVGTPYVEGGEQAARLALERHYRNRGYRDVRVAAQPAVARDGGGVDLAFTVREGQRYVVRAVRTSGVESTRAALVDRATRLDAGSAASPASAEAIRRRLYDIGTFRSADVAYVPVEPAPATPAAGPPATVPVDAVVSLQESRRFLFLYGVEATNQYQSAFDQRVTSGGVAADLRDRNFLGRGWTLGVGARYEPSFWSTRVLASVPRLGSRRIRTNLYADARSEERARTDTVSFRDDETALTLEQRWRPFRPVELSWGYRLDDRHLKFVGVDTQQPLAAFDGLLSSLAGAVVVDRRDSLFDAKRGWLTSMSTEWGLQALGSDFDYLRSLVRTSYYVPVGPLTAAANVRWGHLQSFGGRPPLTALDLFYQAGGTQTVRGYRQDTLSAYELQLPGSPTPVPVGGTTLLVLNGELRFPLIGRVGGAVFADAGNTFKDAGEVALGDLAVGLGFGVRIRTPLAPLRLDLGFPVPRRPGDSTFRWHFSIGQIF